MGPSLLSLSSMLKLTEFILKWVEGVTAIAMAQQFSCAGLGHHEIKYVQSRKQQLNHELKTVQK